MKVKKILYQGIMVNVLVIDDGDEPVPCENCGGAKFDHPLLAREIDADWCLDCNDVAMNLSDKDYSHWVKEQALLGKILFVAVEVNEG